MTPPLHQLILNIRKPTLRFPLLSGLSKQFGSGHVIYITTDENDRLRDSIVGKRDLRFPLRVDVAYGGFVPIASLTTSPRGRRKK